MFYANLLTISHQKFSLVRMQRIPCILRFPNSEKLNGSSTTVVEDADRKYNVRIFGIQNYDNNY